MITSQAAPSSLTTPQPGSKLELENLMGYARRVSSFDGLSLEEQNDLLRNLESYECFTQCVQLLQWRIENSKASSVGLLDDFLWKMRIELFGFENYDSFIATARKCTSTVKLTFSLIRLHFLEELLINAGYALHAKILESVVEYIEQPKEQVLAYQHLATIYEKKLYAEGEVDKCYSKIIAIDSNNLKALRFYKAMYAQMGNWAMAAQQLQLLLEALSHQGERQRAAHELAQLYLYQLGLPEKAKATLDEFCQNSALDTRQTYFDILERMEAFDDILVFLDKLLLQIAEPREQSVVMFKKALVCIKAKRLELAVVHLKNAIDVFPTFLSAYETLITTFLELKKNGEALEWLRHMQKVVQLDSSRKSIELFLKKLG